MDGSSLYPLGFHPVMQESLPHNLLKRAKCYPRYIVPRPVKYYFADFGISVHIPPEKRAMLVTGIHGLDRDPPELSATVPYNPFKLDVFILGNSFKKKLLEVRATVCLETSHLN